VLRRAVLANTLVALVICGVILLAPSAFATTPTLLSTWGSLNWAYGLAAATDGSIYVANTGSSAIQHYTSAGALISQWGGEGAGNGQLSSPEGAAVGPDGTVYVADSGNHRVQRFSATGAYLGQWGSRGDGNAQFWYPEGVAVSSDGIVYVTDTYNARVQYFTSAGTYLGQWGTSGTDPGQFQAPCGIAAGSGGTVYVADPYGANLQSFTATGTLISRFATYGTGEGQVADPQAITIGPDGNVYVTDGNINVFSPSGAFKYRWAGGNRGIAVGADGTIYAIGALGSNVQAYGIVAPAAPAAPEPVSGPAPVFAGKWGLFGYVLPGEFYCPMGIAIAPDGNVFVADFNNARVQGFTSTGTSVGIWTGLGTGLYSPQDVAVAPSGRVYVKDTYLNQIYYFTPSGGPSGIFGSVGSGPGQFNNEPYIAGMGIAVDSAGTVYVSDPRNGRIEYFTADGVYMGEWATAQPGDTKPSACEGLAFAPDGTLYASDHGTGRIVHFTNRGAFLGAFGGYGKTGMGNGEFNTVWALAVGPDGSVFVADTINNRIEQFTAEGTYVTQWGTAGTGDGQFDSPYGVAVASDGTIYVSDYAGRIEYFTPAPAPLWPTTTMSVSPGSADGAAGWYKTVPTVTLSTDRTADRYFQWDATASAGWSAYSSPASALEGAHTIYGYAVDAGGNTEPSHGISLMVDSHAPSTTTLAGSSSKASSVELSWTAVTDATSGLLKYSVYDADSSTLLATTNSTSWSVSGLAAGSTHRYYVTATDVAGNSSQSDTVAVTAQAAAAGPVTTLTASPAAGTGLDGWYVTSAPQITLSSNRLGFSYYQWDSTATAGFVQYSSPLTASRGAHTLYYYSVDPANLAETAKSRSFKVDTSGPNTTALTGWTSGATSAGFSWSPVTDADSGIGRYAIIDADTQAVVASTSGTSASVTGLAAGSVHRYVLRIYDVAGNVSGTSNTVTVTMPVAGPFADVGTSVSVTVSSVKFTFDGVTSAGSVFATPLAAPVAPPRGYRLVGTGYYDLSTGARFSGGVALTLPFNPADVRTSTGELRLFHYSGGVWQNVTSGVDPIAHTITGSTTSFSPFGVFEPDPSYVEPTVSTPASSDWSLALLGLAAVALVGWQSRRRPAA